jgi:hypothetical protein
MPWEHAARAFEPDLEPEQAESVLRYYDDPAGFATECITWPAGRTLTPHRSQVRGACRRSAGYPFGARMVSARPRRRQTGRRYHPPYYQLGNQMEIGRQGPWPGAAMVRKWPFLASVHPG